MTVLADLAQAGTRTLARSHTLADSFVELNTLGAYVSFHLDIPGNQESSWIRCADLLREPAGFTTWRASLRQWLARNYAGEIPARTTAGYVLSWYLQVPALLAGLLFHIDRRVPWLRPQDLAFQLAPDRPHLQAIALLNSNFVGLPNDLAAKTSVMTTVADERALAAVLRARYVGHAARFVAAYAPTVRLGRHTLWGAVTDALDSALWTAGKLCRAEEAGVADAALLLPERIKPFTSGSTLCAIADSGTKHWTRRRESCCFHFALADQQACVTCPRLSEAERSQRALTET